MKRIFVEMLTNSHPSLHSASFAYDLPEEAIALHPVEPRSSARMLVWRKGKMDLNHRFEDLPALLPSATQIWVNNTRVIRARLLLQKPTGGRLEVFLLEPKGQTMEQALAATAPVTWKAMVKGGKRWSAGEAALHVHDVTGSWSLEAHEVGADEGVRYVKVSWKFQAAGEGEFREMSFSQLLEAMGNMPLPPYMRRPETEADSEDYQTVYAEVPGSVAAPTAGLHFDAALMAELSRQQTFHHVTLHVGAGTFKPLGDGSIADHTMHGEQCTVSFESILALSQEGIARVATGTTSLRTLESLYWLAIKWKVSGEQPHELGQWEWCEGLAESEALLGWSMETAMQWCAAKLDGAAWSFTTSIMIAPPYTVRSVQHLITNFHLPNSTLLCLVAAAIGEDWRAVYEAALADGYRFLSFGDGSLLSW